VTGRASGCTGIAGNAKLLFACVLQAFSDRARQYIYFTPPQPLAFQSPETVVWQIPAFLFTGNDLFYFANKNAEN